MALEESTFRSLNPNKGALLTAVTLVILQMGLIVASIMDQVVENAH